MIHQVNRLAQPVFLPRINQTKEKIMPTFEIYFSLMGSGVVEIEANDAEHAEDLLVDYSTDELIEMCEFDDGLQLDSIDEN